LKKPENLKMVSKIVKMLVEFHKKGAKGLDSFICVRATAVAIIFLEIEEYLEKEFAEYFRR